MKGFMFLFYESKCILYSVYRQLKSEPCRHQVPVIYVQHLSHVQLLQVTSLGPFKFQIEISSCSRCDKIGSGNLYEEGVEIYKRKQESKKKREIKLALGQESDQENDIEKNN